MFPTWHFLKTFLQTGDYNPSSLVYQPKSLKIWPKCLVELALYIQVLLTSFTHNEHFLFLKPSFSYSHLHAADYDTASLCNVCHSHLPTKIIHISPKLSFSVTSVSSSLIS